VQFLFMTCCRIVLPQPMAKLSTLNFTPGKRSCRNTAQNRQCSFCS
jgi:hypothetical protein